MPKKLKQEKPKQDPPTSKEHVYLILTQFFLTKFNDFKEKQRKKAHTAEFMGICETIPKFKVYSQMALKFVTPSSI